MVCTIYFQINRSELVGFGLYSGGFGLRSRYGSEAPGMWRSMSLHGHFWSSSLHPFPELNTARVPFEPTGDFGLWVKAPRAEAQMIAFAETEQIPFAWGEMTVEPGMRALVEDDGYKRPDLHGHIFVDDITFDRVDRMFTRILRGGKVAFGNLDLSGATLQAGFDNPREWVHPSEIVRPDRAVYAIERCNVSESDLSTRSYQWEWPPKRGGPPSDGGSEVGVSRAGEGT